MNIWNYVVSRRPRGGENSLLSPSRPVPKRRNMLPSPETKPHAHDAANSQSHEVDCMSNDFDSDSNSFDINPPPQTRKHDPIPEVEIVTQYNRRPWVLQQQKQVRLPHYHRIKKKSKRLYLRPQKHWDVIEICMSYPIIFKTIYVHKINVYNLMILKYLFVHDFNQ